MSGGARGIWDDRAAIHCRVCGDARVTLRRVLEGRPDLGYVCAGCTNVYGRAGILVKAAQQELAGVTTLLAVKKGRGLGRLARVTTALHALRASLSGAAR